MFQISALIHAQDALVLVFAPAGRLAPPMPEWMIHVCMYGSSGYGRDVRSSQASDASDTEPSVGITNAAQLLTGHQSDNTAGTND